MKKVIFLSVAFMSLCLITPQISHAMDASNKITLSQQKDVKYQEIKSDELPTAINSAVSRDYAGFTVDKAYKGDDGNYKVVAKNGDTKHVLYYNASGTLSKVDKNWDKAKKPSHDTVKPPMK